MDKKIRESADIGFREVINADARMVLPESDADRRNRRIAAAMILLFVAAVGMFSLFIRNERSVTSSLGVILLIFIYLITDIATKNRKMAGKALAIAAVPMSMLLTFDSTGGIINLMWILLVPGCAAGVSDLRISGITGITLTVFFAAAFYTPLNMLLPGSYTAEVKNIYPLLYIFAFQLSFWIDYFRRKKTVLLNNRGAALENTQKDLDKKSDDMNRKIIRATIGAMEAKDDLTRNHSVRVARYSAMLAEALGWDRERIEEIYQGGMLHDIGKIGVDDSILKKSDSLTDWEYKKIQEHTIIGKAILEDMSWLPKAVLCAESHHERYDGKGYPYGLKGEEIPIEARIVALADSFDAMNANRVYREHLTKEKIIEELKKGSGTQFDPELAAKFIPIAQAIMESDEEAG